MTHLTWCAMGMLVRGRFEAALIVSGGRGTAGTILRTSDDATVRMDNPTHPVNLLPHPRVALHATHALLMQLAPPMRLSRRQCPLCQRNCEPPSMQVLPQPVPARQLTPTAQVLPCPPPHARCRKIARLCTDSAKVRLLCGPGVQRIPCCRDSSSPRPCRVESYPGPQFRVLCQPRAIERKPLLKAAHTAAHPCAVTTWP